MAGTGSQIREDWKKIQKDLLEYERNSGVNLTARRKVIRERVLRGEDAGIKDEIGLLLKKEYELEREEDLALLTVELIRQGKDPKSAEFQHEIDFRMARNDLALFDQNDIDNYRKTVRERASLGEPIAQADVAGQLLLKEFNAERAMDAVVMERSYIAQGYEKDSALLKKTMELKLLQMDMMNLDEAKTDRIRTDLREKWATGVPTKIDTSYEKLIHREYQLEQDIAAIEAAERERIQQEKIKQEEINRKIEEASAKEAERILREAGEDFTAKSKTAGTQESERLFDKVQKFLARTSNSPEKKEAKTDEPTAKETQLPEQDLSKDTGNSVVKENEKKPLEESKEATAKQPQMSVTEIRRKERQQQREEEQRHKYRVEFAGDELSPEMRGCGDTKKLAEYLKNATALSKEAKEHLENRILANAKIQSYEESRAIKQKLRPPAVQYKDGTILLKNKKKDVPKMTTLNGCWSAVLSDMLAHFGVELTQEEVRAYRPDFTNAPGTQKDAGMAIDRFNKDTFNEINDMADLIQRTVPNVAHHHMSLGVGREENKALFKESVSDALLNKNSPVAVLYGNHYLSIVGIKDNTLIVQNPSQDYNSKYQKLSIDDLFEGCKEGNSRGQVTIDWLEDLKFEKNGACKNINEKWKNMGIECDRREFKAAGEKPYMTHVRGNEYYDASRIEQGVDETIYLPKMSFGRERELAQVEIQKQQLQNVKDGILTLDDLKKDSFVKDDPEMEPLDFR